MGLARFLFLLCFFAVSCVFLRRLLWLQSHEGSLRRRKNDGKHVQIDSGLEVVVVLYGTKSSGDTLDKNSTETSLTVEKNTKLSDGVSESQPEDLLAQKRASYKEHASFLGVIRMPRTRAQAVLSFLEYESGLRPYRDYLRSDFVDSCKQDGQKEMPFCLYATSQNDGSAEERESSHDGEISVEVNENNQELACPHLGLLELGAYWDKSLKYVNPLTFMSVDPVTKRASFRVSLEFLGVVRDPFSRLRDIFYHTQHDCHSSRYDKDFFTPTQYERVCANDFEVWMELLHKEESTVPPQFQFFSLEDSTQDVDTAISIIHGDDPEVYVVLDECFEESLRFMEKQFSLSPGATDTFLDSPRAALMEYGDVPSLDEVDFKLRKAAKEWFHDDYKFYNAAVEKFRRQMASVDLDPSTVRNPCDHMNES